MAQRFTVTRLRADVEDINGWLADAGSRLRLETGGRNGYQAVDEYEVDADGARIGSGVRRNVQCGSSRECAAAAREHYNNEFRRIERAACTCRGGS